MTKSQAWEPSRRALTAGLGTLLLAGAPGLGAAQGRSKTAPSLPAQASAEENFVSLNGEWRFALGETPLEAEALSGFYRSDFDTSAFAPTPVPSNWVMQGFGQPTYNWWKGRPAPEGFYLRRFAAPAAWKDRRVILRFDGVWASAEVWLNGVLLGRQDTGFIAIAFEFSSALKPGEDNLLAVRVRQSVPDYKLDTNDDWALGGIYRDVTLEITPKDIWIDRIETRTRFDQYFRDADLDVRVMVNDHRKRMLPTTVMNQGKAPYVLRLTLIDAQGVKVQTQDTLIAPHYGAGSENALSMRVSRPAQWTAETPNLYRLEVDLIEEGQRLHRQQTSVGFREISTQGGVLRINGQAVKLRGTNRHDEHPDVGRATTLAQWTEDLTLMKAANINYIRLAHYPPAKGFLDACDRMGLYVSNEVPMGFGGDDLEDHPERAGAVLERTYLTVARDINHPSVIIWTVGNEDPLTTLHMAAIRTVKGLDPSRPVLIPLRAERGLPKEIDILAPHYWTARMYEEEAGRAERPLVTTEFSHAYGEEGFGGFQDRWKALTRHAAGAGGAMWLWADQGLTVRKPKPDGTEERTLTLPAAGFDGIVDSYRKPTRDYWEAKAVYAQVYPAVDLVTFVAGQVTVRVPIQNDFDFTDLKVVQIEWRLMEDDRELAKGRAGLDGVTHAASDLELPVGAIDKVRPGATYYFWLTFRRGDGGEITRRTVELRSTATPPPAAAARAALEVVRESERLRVLAGEVEFVFDPTRGHLASAAHGGAVRLTGLRPTLWRELNATERLKFADRLPDLNRFEASAKAWRVSEADGQVAIQAKVLYRVDAKNSFLVAYDYVVDASGALNVHYVITPSVEAKWTPQVGLELQASPDLENIRWLGLGPLDAWPNMKAAPVLGVYADRFAAPAGARMKALRWADFVDRTGAGFKVRTEGYLSYAAETPGRIQLLSEVVGRQQKADRPEPPYRLDIDPARPFVGAITLQLHTP